MRLRSIVNARTPATRLFAVLVGALFLGACADRTVVQPDVAATPTAFGQRLTCAADVRAGQMSCAPSTIGANASLTLGGQGTYIRLVAKNSSYTAGTSIFQSDISVQNLTAQPLGTSDGTTVSGVKAFIASGPTVTSGTGAVTVNNADGTGTFTASNQSFFLYNQILEVFSGTSALKTWQFNVPSTVNFFTFTVLVSAQAPAETELLRWTAERGNPVLVQSVWGADAQNVFACGNGVCYRSTPSGFVAMNGWTISDSLGRAGSQILGMGGTSPTDVWAVGGGLIAHFDGNRWSSMIPPTSVQLNDVEAVSPTEVYVVGLGNNQVYRYNGTAWSAVHTLPGSGVQIRVVSPTSVWVSASGGLAHWNGTAWTNIAAPSGQIFRGLWAVSDTDIWVGATSGNLYRFDGTTFTQVSSPSTATLWGFAGFSSTNIYATNGQQIIHWDGTSWTLVTTLPVSTVAASMWAASPTDMYISGYNGAGQLYRFNGTTFSNTGSPMSYLAELWGSSASDVYTVGNSGTILHNSGSGWVTEGSGTTGFFSSVWGASASDVWAVGNLGAFALRRTGSSWGFVPKATARVLRDNWGASANAVWAVGDTGTIEKFDGSSWTAQSSGTTQFLWGVHGTSATDVWAVGNAGTILHYNGSAWSNAAGTATTTDMTLDGVFATSTSNAWIVGAFSDGRRVLLKWDGTAWGPGPSAQLGGMNGPGGVFCINGSGPNDIWAGGGYGGLFHWNGSAWRPVPTGSGINGCAWSTSPTNVYISGTNGVILHGTP